MREIRVHGRGGQGVVLASEIFVHALIQEGRFAACFPFFGFERRGAPVFGFIRFDEKPIRQKDQVYTPDCVVVMDSTLFKAVNVYQGIKAPGTLILNDSRPLEELAFPPEIRRVGLVDATRISLDTIKTFIPNTAMLGALCRTTGWAELSSLLKSLKEAFPVAIRQKNVEMLQRAYEETKVFDI
jgi:phenylglyoxylate dehydrogenase gamma subunit